MDDFQFILVTFVLVLLVFCIANFVAILKVGDMVDGALRKLDALRQAIGQLENKIADDSEVDH